MDIRDKSAEYLARTGLNTSTKITYNSAGAVVRGGSATADDIIETVNRRFVTNLQSTAINNLSGINTGDDAVNSLYSSLVGIPTGGTTGQVLSKIDNANYNVQWVTSGGGGSGDALTTNPLSQFAATTKVQLNSVISDGVVMFVGDAPTAHTHTIADITDFGIYSTDIHSNIAALNLVSGTNTGDQDLSGLLVKANNLSDLTNIVTARTNLGLGTLATQSGTFSGTSSGTNTGDQITIVGITGTKSQFDTALTDGNFMFIGDAPTGHTHLIADITDFGVYSTDIHSNITALNAVSGINTGDQTTIAGISGTKAQFNTSVSDGDIFFVDNITGTPNGTKFLRDDFSWATISSSGTKSINTISINTNADSTSGVDYYYLCDGDITLTLPTAVGNTSKYVVKNVGTGVITIDTTLSQLIDGWDQVTISFENNSLDIISDGANYRIT